jgi:lipopolysaccharide biosynthesis glycosyltransferase
MNANIYIGWDSRETIAADVCEMSIYKNASEPVVVKMLKQQDLRDQRVYTRPVDTQASTEFTFTRFLVPHLNDYKGWAVFCDCDFLWTGDIQELLTKADDRYAVMVVKHDYRPQSMTKMDGKAQSYYPRKNWSSMILWNCEHPANRKLTLDVVNSQSGAYLHRFQWLKDREIGTLTPEWNWLVNWYHEPWDGAPKAIHYTEGGPWFSNYRDCAYGHLWLEYQSRLQDTYVNHNLIKIKDLHLPEVYRSLLAQIIDAAEDPFMLFGNSSTPETIHAKITHLLERTPQVIGLSEETDLNKKQIVKGAKWDGIVHAFVQGATGVMASWDRAQDLSAPIALRSIAKRKVMKHCLEVGRDFYYIDTGYFGNVKVKDYHRITKNAMQWLGPTEIRPADRLERTRVRARPMTPGSKILICPPSAKAMSYWELDEQQWIDDTIATIQKFTDRPIEVRLKQPREQRARVNTMEQALADDVHCMVTFNSIAAVESLIYGKPVFAMGPNAAAPLANTDLSQIENPFIPSLDQVTELLRCLAYHQFTVEEMSTGYAWAVLSGQA